MGRHEMHVLGEILLDIQDYDHLKGDLIDDDGREHGRCDKLGSINGQDPSDSKTLDEHGE
ncbi:hypothetical protein CR513_45436, partial [Mucuna pruriens]